jgi:ATP synthase protein I
MASLSRDNIRLIGQLSTVGLSFVFALVIGFGGGYYLDRWLGTSPWLTFLGFFVGLAAGIVNVYRVLQLAGRPTSTKGPEE